MHTPGKASDRDPQDETPVGGPETDAGSSGGELSTEPWWVKGQHPDRDTFKMILTVCEMRERGMRRVISAHDFDDAKSAEIAQGLASQGEEQIVFALLAEMMKREARLQVLIQLSADPEYLNDVSNVDAKKLASTLMRSLTMTIHRHAPGVAERVLEEMKLQHRQLRERLSDDADSPPPGL